MSRYIDADALIEIMEERKRPEVGADASKERYRYIQWLADYQAINNAPSIDIVRCKECKWSKANGTYQWCGRLDSTARITADDFCSYGVRKTNTTAEEKPTPIRDYMVHGEREGE